MQFQATRHDQFACSRSYAAGEMTLHTVSAKTGHTARPRNFPITGRSDRRNVSTSHRRSLRKLQFLHNRLEARLLAQEVHPTPWRKRWLPAPGYQRLRSKRAYRRCERALRPKTARLLLIEHRECRRLNAIRVRQHIIYRERSAVVRDCTTDLSHWLAGSFQREFGGACIDLDP